MLADLTKLYQYRELLWMWTIRDIRVRYKQSLLGIVWAILQPLSLMAVFTVVFSYLARVPTDGVPYPVFSYSALLPWTFFAASVGVGVPSVVANMQLVTKIYLPREIFPIASICASFVDFLVASSIFLVLMLFYQIPLHVTVLYVPLLLGVQVLLTLGVTLLAAAANVFYRDVRFIIPLGLQLWMYASPIIYPISMVPERLQPLYMLNPMASLIHSYRRSILLGQPPVWSNLLVCTVIAVLLAIAGYTSFKRVEGLFADII